MKYNKKLYPFESKWIALDNHNIHYVDEGQGQVILFSHAPLASSFMYRKLIHKLSENYRCVALDFPGFGISYDDPARKYSIVTQSEILRQFIHQLRLSDIIGFGHDTGGPSLFKVAVDSPELFKGLILTDTIIFPTNEYPRIHNMLGVVGSRIFRQVNAVTNLLVRLTYSLGVPTRRLTQNELKQYSRLFRTHHQRRRITEMLYSLKENNEFMQRVKAGFENQLRSKPILLIYGENDPVNKLGIADRIHKMMKNSELFLIKKEGHFPHEGQPERMIEIVDSWMIKLLAQQNDNNLKGLMSNHEFYKNSKQNINL